MVIPAILLISCASLGSHTNIAMPELVPSMKKVAVWPIRIYPIDKRVDEKVPGLSERAYADIAWFQDYSDYFSSSAENLLLAELDSLNRFILISPDSVASAVFNNKQIDIRLAKASWSDIPNELGADVVLFTNLYFKGGGQGSNSFITLSFVDSKTGNLILETNYNTLWGNNYMLHYPTVERTCPDAIIGSIKSLRRVFDKY